MKQTNLKAYESPKAEVIEIESQGVLCASGDATRTGGTNDMDINNIEGW